MANVQFDTVYTFSVTLCNEYPDDRAVVAKFDVVADNSKAALVKAAAYIEDTMYGEIQKVSMLDKQVVVR